MRQTIPKVLLIGSNCEGADVAEILRQFASVTRVSMVPTVLPEENYDAVFCVWDCAEGPWKDIMPKVQELHLEAPIVVLSRCGREKEWIEVLESGAFEFLVPPYTSAQILAVLEHAVACSQARKEHSFTTA